MAHPFHPPRNPAVASVAWAVMPGWNYRWADRKRFCWCNFDQFSTNGNTQLEEWSPCLLTETEWEEGSVFITCHNQTKSESWNGLDMRWHVVISPSFLGCLDSTTLYKLHISGSHRQSQSTIACSPKFHENHWKAMKFEEPKYANIKLANIDSDSHPFSKKSGHGTVIPSSCASMAVEPTWAHHEFLWVPPLWHEFSFRIWWPYGSGWTMSKTSLVT